MTESQKPVFFVSAYTDPVAIKITGKANYMNSSSFREFMEKMLKNGKSNYLVDFSFCTGMDSTFLGILSGFAFQIRNMSPPGSMLLSQLGDRNYELIHNLGLQHILTIKKMENQDTQEFPSESYTDLDNNGVLQAETVLKAHENLVEANKDNARKFQDVIAFLRNNMDEHN